MADSSIAITPGAGASIDTRTNPGGDHRQVIVVGDPSADAVAGVSTAGALLVQGFQSSRSTGNITTASTTIPAVDVSNYNIVTVTIRGTHAGINLTFEASDDGGTNYFPVMAARTDIFSAAATSGVITSNASWAWDVPIGAFTHFRVRSTAWTSGTGVVGITAQSMPYEPVPTVGIAAGTAVIGALTANQSVNVAQMNGVATTMGNGVAGTGVQRVAVASDNTPFTVNTTPTAPTTTGNTLSSAATTNATSLKASAGTLYTVTASNTGAATAYLKLYNKASAPTVGTDVPVLTIPIAAGSAAHFDWPPQGFRFATGIAYAITNLAPDSDTTAIAAAQVKVMWSYI